MFKTVTMKFYSIFILIPTLAHLAMSAISLSDKLKAASFQNVSNAVCRHATEWIILASVPFVNAQYPFELFAINAENNYQVVLRNCDISPTGVFVFRNINVISKACVNESDEFYFSILYSMLYNTETYDNRKSLCEDQLREQMKTNNTTMEIGQVSDDIWFLIGRNGDERGLLVLGSEAITDETSIWKYVEKALVQVKEKLSKTRIKWNNFRNESHHCPARPLFVNNSTLCSTSQNLTSGSESSEMEFEHEFELRAQLLGFLVVFTSIVLIIVLCVIKNKA